MALALAVTARDLDVAVNKDPYCCCTFITCTSEWEGVRSDRRSPSFKGGIPPYTAKALEHSNAYLINGCLCVTMILFLEVYIIL